MRGRKRKGEVPVEDTDRIITMYEEEVSLENIIAMYNDGFTPYVLREFLVGQGITIRPRGRKRVTTVTSALTPSDDYIDVSKVAPLPDNVVPFYNEWR